MDFKRIQPEQIVEAYKKLEEKGIAPTQRSFVSHNPNTGAVCSVCALSAFYMDECGIPEIPNTSEGESLFVKKMMETLETRGYSKKYLDSYWSGFDRDTVPDPPINLNERGQAYMDGHAAWIAVKQYLEAKNSDTTEQN